MEKHSLYPKHICNDTRQRQSNMVHMQTIYLKHSRHVWIYWEAWDDTCHMYDCSCFAFQMHISAHEPTHCPPPPPPPLPSLVEEAPGQTMLVAQCIEWPFVLLSLWFHHCVFLLVSSFVALVCPFPVFRYDLYPIEPIGFAAAACVHVCLCIYTLILHRLSLFLPIDIDRQRVN